MQIKLEFGAIVTGLAAMASMGDISPQFPAHTTVSWLEVLCFNQQTTESTVLISKDCDVWL